jgi:lactate dehydrogenase-like 2-hydroxyacid dehydrogenase
VPADLLAHLPQTKVVSVFGVGYDGVDVSAAIRSGIPVTHTPDVLTDDVADLAMGLVLSVGRTIPQADQFVRQGLWPHGPIALGKKVSGARLGIVGLGRIGKAIAQRAQAFNMSIAYTARSEKPGTGYTYYPTPAALAAQVDFLVVITPGGAGTRHLIDAQVLQALGPKGYLINVARGSVVDETALVAALQAGTIAGAGLDVFADEPHVPQALWTLPHVVLTPHMASATRETRQAMADLAFANLHAGVTGAPLRTPVPECAAR